MSKKLIAALAVLGFALTACTSEPATDDGLNDDSSSSVTTDSSASSTMSAVDEDSAVSY